MNKNNIIYLNEYMPHLEGQALCIGCRHRWRAITPVGTIELECPKCLTLKGRHYFEALKDGDHWTCKCGCYHFARTREQIYCANCGTVHNWYVTDCGDSNYE